MKRLFPPLLILIVVAVSCVQMTGCGDILFPPPRFDLAFSTPKGEPVYIERVIYDDSFEGICGILACCWKTAGGLNSLAPPFPPVPKKIFIRWFNYKQQKYYEATINLPEETEKHLKRLPQINHGNHKLTTGVKPDGEAVVWVSNGLSELTGTWIEVARAQGHEAQGDPAEYSTHIEDMRKRGEIP